LLPRANLFIKVAKSFREVPICDSQYLLTSKDVFLTNTQSLAPLLPQIRLVGLLAGRKLERPLPAVAEDGNTRLLSATAQTLATVVHSHARVVETFASWFWSSKPAFARYKVLAMKGA
jgi:hypothetical protein